MKNQIEMVLDVMNDGIRSDRRLCRTDDGVYYTTDSTDQPNIILPVVEDGEAGSEDAIAYMEILSEKIAGA